MAKRSSVTPFHFVERAVVALYDGGVLSPAVLERLLDAFMGIDVDWNSDAKARSVDGRSLHEIVATTMMPGRSSRTAAKDFASIIEHFETNSAATPPTHQTASEAEDVDEEAEEDDELLEQLGGGSRSTKRSAAASKRSTTSGSSAGFNPFINARPPGGKK